MDNLKLDIGIPQQSIIYIGLCLIGVLIFILAGILPASRTLAEMENRTATARYRLEEQKILSPFYQTLIEWEGKKESEILPLPEKGKLPQAKINTLPLNLSNAARMSGMSLVSAIPNLKALVGDAQFMPVSVVLRGDFADFRRFLINLGGLPYVERIEEITIQEKPGAREYRLILWVAIG
jgi:Tfp pilus assembly protein PilO